jgi:glycosyltransferase involved in cell wall biosynthesis
VSGVRLLVVDDNPHVRWAGRTHPANATFHRFLAAVLDAGDGLVSEIVHAVPLRDATVAPRTAPLDERIRVVGTAPFDGIAGFLRHARSVTRTNRAVLEPLVAEADLVWLKLPASNAALAGRLAGRTGTPRFGWVAGSARAVAAASGGSPLARLPRIAVGASYDLVGRFAGGGRRIVVGEGVVHGGGIVASLVTPAEVRPTAGAAWVPDRPVRLAWAGRVARGKGLAELPEMLRVLPDAELVMLGEGPARPEVEARARRLGVQDRIVWRGLVADREAYLDALAAAHIVVHPSPAEGFPKVVLDAMAAGTPVAATPAGNVDELAAARLIAPIGRGRGPAHATTAAVFGLIQNPVATQAMRERATSFVADHTAAAEAGRLLDRLRTWFPDLPWD